MPTALLTEVPDSTAVRTELSNSSASVSMVVAAGSTCLSRGRTTDGVNPPVETSSALSTGMPSWRPRLSFTTAEMDFTIGA